MFCRSIDISHLGLVKLSCTYLVSGCCKAWGRAGSSIDAAVTAVWTHTIWRAKNGLDTANAAPFERYQTIRLQA
jgi:hypothetical protein